MVFWYVYTFVYCPHPPHKISDCFFFGASCPLPLLDDLRTEENEDIVPSGGGLLPAPLRGAVSIHVWRTFRRSLPSKDSPMILISNYLRRVLQVFCVVKSYPPTISQKTFLKHGRFNPPTFQHLFKWHLMGDRGKSMPPEKMIFCGSTEMVTLTGWVTRENNTHINLNLWFFSDIASYKSYISA